MLLLIFYIATRDTTEGFLSGVDVQLMSSKPYYTVNDHIRNYRFPYEYRNYRLDYPLYNYPLYNYPIYDYLLYDYPLYNYSIYDYPVYNYYKPVFY